MVSKLTADLVRSSELDPDKQKAIWDLEHAVFELETFLGKPFIQAIVDRNLSSMARAFRNDFAGYVISGAPKTVRKQGPISEMRLEAPTAGSQKTDASASQPAR